MKGKLQLGFDWRAIGLTAYFPFFITVVLMGYCFIKSFSIKEILPALELSLTTFAAWWSIFLFQDVLEEEGAEVIFSLPISRWKLGTVRVGFFFFIYLSLLAIVVLFIQLGTHSNVFFPLFCQLSVEAFFFSSFGFLSMMITASSSWALVSIVSYVSIQILTKGAFIPWINIYLFNDRIYPTGEIVSWFIAVLLAGLSMWIIAQMLLIRMRRFH